MTANPSRPAFVASGLAIACFFALMIAIAAMRPDYSHGHKAISELGAFGAPWMFA